MLKKIVSIKNVGRFRNSSASGNPQLTKYTLIAGANGFGKTTLCAILRSLKSSDPSHILGRKTLGTAEVPEAELLLDSGLTKFNGTKWSVPYSAVEIFDGVFVAENVHSGEVVEIDQKRNFYRIIVGETGVQLAEEDTALAGASRDKTSEITASARAIQPHLPGGMSLDAFIALSEDPEIDQRILEQERTVEGIRQAANLKARSGLAEVVIPPWPDTFLPLLRRSIDDIAQDAEAQVAKHLADHGMSKGGGNWVAEGLAHVVGDACPFCGQDLKGISLIAAYRAVFSEKYRALANDVAELRAAIETAFGDVALARLDSRAAENKSGVEFWSRYCPLDPPSLDYPADVTPALRSLRQAALALLDRKARAPLETITPDSAFAAALEAFSAARGRVDGLNAAIRLANALVVAKKAETGAADLKIAESELGRRKAIKTRHLENVDPLCSAHGQLIAAKEAIDKKRVVVRDQLDRHTQSVVKPYERRINELLDAFNAGFAITETRHSYPGGIATSTYQLVINHTAIEVGDGKTPADKPSFKNTLSAGDRTTLALAFFLAHLERDGALATKTVVFDDPFNSQDAFRRRQTVHEIVKLAASCAQVVVLSHDATFLRQVWEKAPAAERVSLIIADHRAQGSKLLPMDLEKATQGRTATDIDDLQTFLTTGAGALLDIVRKMRVVLETYCRTTYASSFVSGDWLGDMVRKIREGGANHPAQVLYDELDQINEFTKQYHHGEDMEDATPDQIDPTELTGYARRTLRIANALQA